jgi:urease accessory protein
MSNTATTTTIEPLALLRLIQLVSPGLPVGAFNFSQGLEYAIEQRWVQRDEDAQLWILGIARYGLGTLDLPMLLRMHHAWSGGDVPLARALSRELIAARETLELRAEERHLGQSLAKIIVEFGFEEAREWLRLPQTSYAAMFSLAAVRSGIDAQTTAQGYLWAWAENQVLCAVKLLPLGQTAGQRVLDAIRQEIPAIVAQAVNIGDDAIGSSTPLASMASGWHETQYTRLFRS